MLEVTLSLENFENKICIMQYNIPAKNLFFDGETEQKITSLKAFYTPSRNYTFKVDFGN